MVFLRRGGEEGEGRPGSRTSPQVGEEEAVEGEGLLLLCWEGVGQGEQGQPESRSGWRGEVGEVMCCVRFYWLRREGEEGGDHPGLRSERVVEEELLCGQEGAEEEELGLWSVPGEGAEVPSGRREEGESVHLSRAQEGGAPVCLAEDNSLC